MLENSRICVDPEEDHICISLHRQWERHTVVYPHDDVILTAKLTHKEALKMGLRLLALATALRESKK